MTALVMAVSKIFKAPFRTWDLPRHILRGALSMVAWCLEVSLASGPGQLEKCWKTIAGIIWENSIEKQIQGRFQILGWQKYERAARGLKIDMLPSTGPQSRWITLPQLYMAGQSRKWTLEVVISPEMPQKTR